MSTKLTQILLTKRRKKPDELNPPAHLLRGKATAIVQRLLAFYDVTSVSVLTSTTNKN